MIQLGWRQNHLLVTVISNVKLNAIFVVKKSHWDPRSFNSLVEKTGGGFLKKKRMEGKGGFPVENIGGIIPPK